MMQFNNVEKQIEGLEYLSREEIVELWCKLMGSMPFKGARDATLVRHMLSCD